MQQYYFPVKQQLTQLQQQHLHQIMMQQQYLHDKQRVIQLQQQLLFATALPQYQQVTQQEHRQKFLQKNNNIAIKSLCNNNRS